jgi:hypothetical protein
MTDNTKNAVLEFHNTLDEQQHETFGAWEKEVQDIAAGMSTAIDPLGLLSLVLKDAQWAAYPGSRTIVTGNPQIALRYQPPTHVTLLVTMTSPEILVTKEVYETRRHWTDSSTSLKRIIVKSLGEVVRKIIRDKKHFFQLLSIADIIQRVRTRYGIMHKNIRASLMAKMTTMLKTVDGIESHVASLEALFETYDAVSKCGPAGRRP